MHGQVTTPSGNATATVPWDASDFEPLGRASRQALGAHARTLTFQPSEMLMREGRPTPFLGLIVSGRVALRLPVPTRAPHTVVTLEPGDLIGWSAIVAPYRATADAVAQIPTRIVAFDAESVRKLLASDCAIAAEVLPLVLVRVSDRLTTSWHQLLDLFGMRGVGPW